jgi:hypothetical protein
MAPTTGSIPQKRAYQYHNWDVLVPQAKALIAGGLSEYAAAKQLGLDPKALWRAMRKGAPTVRQSAPAIDDQIIIDNVKVDPPQPSVPSALQYADHEARIATLEAFIKALQARPASYLLSAPSTPEYTEPTAWKKSGADFAPDMFEAVREYARVHRVHVRVVVDMALRHFFAAGEVADG